MGLGLPGGCDACQAVCCHLKQAPQFYSPMQGHGAGLDPADMSARSHAVCGRLIHATSSPLCASPAGEGVGFDPANMSVTNVAGAESLEGTEGGRSGQHMGSTTLMGNRGYEVG